MSVKPMGSVDWEEFFQLINEDVTSGHWSVALDQEKLKVWKRPVRVHLCLATEANGTGRRLFFSCVSKRSIDLGRSAAAGMAACLACYAAGSAAQAVLDGFPVLFFRVSKTALHLLGQRWAGLAVRVRY